MDRTVVTSLGEVEVLEALRVRAQDLYPEVVERYVAALERGDRLPDLLVARLADRLLLLDGRHRIAAWEAAGVPIVARVGWKVADMGEALVRAMAANVRHGEPPRFGDVARCVELALGVWPDLSAREIARRVGCSHTLVNRVRDGQTAPQVETVSTPKPLGGQDELGAAPSYVEEVMAAEPLDGRYAAGPEYIADEDGYPVFNIHNERPDLGVDSGRINLEPRIIAHTLKLEGGDEDGLSWSVIKPGEIRPVVEAPVVKEDTAPKAYRGKDALERWYTDSMLTTVCWRWLVGLGVLPGREVWTVLEPAVGDGAWVRGAAVVGLERLPKIAWDSCDLDGVAQRPSELRARGVVGDFLEVCWADQFDLVITNPPNSKAFEFVRRSLELVVPGGVVAFLMPLSWYAAQGRRAWLEENPPYRVGVCPWRPSFGGPAAELQGTGNGTPTQVYALFVWVQGYQGETVLEIIPGGEVGDGEE